MRHARPPMRNHRSPRPAPPRKGVAIAAAATSAQDAKVRTAAVAAARVAGNQGKASNAVSVARARNVVIAANARNADRVLSSKAVRSARQENHANLGKHVSPETDAAPANPGASSVRPKHVPMKHRRRCLPNNARNRLSLDSQAKMVSAVAGAEDAAVVKGAKVVKVVKVVRTAVSNAKVIPSTQSNARMRRRLPSLRLNQPLQP